MARLSTLAQPSLEETGNRRDEHVARARRSSAAIPSHTWCRGDAASLSPGVRSTLPGRKSPKVPSDVTLSLSPRVLCDSGVSVCLSVCRLTVLSSFLHLWLRLSRLVLTLFGRRSGEEEEEEEEEDRSFQLVKRNESISRFS